jgi:hypothetical protein
MNKEQRKSEYLRKLIDLPRPLVKELQALAKESDKSLKGYIEGLILDDIRKKTPATIGVDLRSDDRESHSHLGE